MSFFVEFHLIQNFAPSNLNRDDTGAPKDALFGGHRRARVSSQCFKRSVRTWVRTHADLPTDALGTRTLHLERLLGDELNSLGLADISKFNEIVKLALKKKAGKDKTDSQDDKEEDSSLSYLLFISPAEIGAFKQVIATYGDVIKTLAAKKKLKTTDIPDELRQAVKDTLSRVRAVDIALFGRMLADLPEANRYAACQVAHSISTHRVETEFDYFTAMDDLATPAEAGAAMIDNVQFNSATFYRYAVLDADKLAENLQGDCSLTVTGTTAFTDALARAIPTGKQNTFAAHNQPAFVGVAIRRASPFNLANAFEKPVWPDRYKALTTQSVEALAAHEKQLASFYGDARDTWAFIDLTGAWPQDLGEAQTSLAELTAWVGRQVAAHLGVAVES